MIDTNTLRKKILDLAIRGKLVPQDPADEPASVLLERIREEKQRLIREGKIKKDKVDSIIFRGEDNCHYEKIGDTVKKIQDEIPFEIPESWCWVRFPQIVRYKMGKTPERANMNYWKDGTIPWISISDMERGKTLLSTKEKIEKSVEKTEAVKPAPTVTAPKAEEAAPAPKAEEVPAPKAESFNIVVNDEPAKEAEEEVEEKKTGFFGRFFSRK